MVLRLNVCSVNYAHITGPIPKNFLDMFESLFLLPAE